MYEDIDDIGDLLDAETAIDIELGDLGAPRSPAARKRQAQLQVKKGRVLTQLRTLQGRIGGINPQRLRRLVPTARMLYCHRRIASGTVLTAGAEFEFFGKGIGDSAESLGWPAGSLTARHTNMGQEGRLPNGEFFFLHGSGVDLVMLPNGDTSDETPRQVHPNNLFWFGNMTVRYEEGQGTRSLALGTVAEMPPQHWIATELASGLTTAGGIREATRQAGPAYRRKAPIAVFQGGDRIEQNRVILRNHETVAALDVIDSNNPAQLSVYLYGIWWQHPAKATQT